MSKRLLLLISNLGLSLALFVISQHLSNTDYSDSGLLYSAFNKDFIEPLLITSLVLLPGTLILSFAPGSALRKWLQLWPFYLLVLIGIFTLPTNTNTWFISWDLTRAPAMYIWAAILNVIALFFALQALFLKKLTTKKH